MSDREYLANELRTIQRTLYILETRAYPNNRGRSEEYRNLDKALETYIEKVLSDPDDPPRTIPGDTKILSGRTNVFLFPKGEALIPGEND